MALVCTSCGGEIGPSMKACPSCGRLVHADQLKGLAASARAAENEDRLVDALTHLREMLDLLPPQSSQYDVIRNEAARLSDRVASTPTRELKPAGAPLRSTKTQLSLGAIGAAIVISLKFKDIFILLLSQAKLLFAGLGKGATIGTMFLSLGVYWTAWGWKLAAGLILGIYVHEMGHVWMMKRFGMRLSAPLFIPGIGAFVELKQHPVNPVEDARIGIAGPVWGTVFMLGTFLLFQFFKDPFWSTLSHFLAWITVFNLLPLWQLDGARSFRGFSLEARWVVLAGALGGYLVTREGLFGLLGFMVFIALNNADPRRKTDRQAFMSYLAVLTLSIAILKFTPSALAK
jgi:Zn-dependent protease